MHLTPFATSRRNLWCRAKSGCGPIVGWFAMYYGWAVVGCSRYHECRVSDVCWMSPWPFIGICDEMYEYNTMNTMNTCTTSYRCAYHQQKTLSSQVTGVETRVWNGLDQSAGFIIQSSPGGFGLDWIRNSPTQRILDSTGSINVQCIGSHILYSPIPYLETWGNFSLS